MSKMGKTIVALGVVAGLGVAALPMTSYAAGTTTVSKNLTVSVAVADAISLSLLDTESNAVTSVAISDVEADTLAESAAVTASVTTNHPTGYKLTLTDSDEDTDLIQQTPADPPQDWTAATINTLDAEGYGWGVKGGELENYTAVPKKTTGTALTLKTTESETTGDASTTDIYFGVKVKPGQRAATYEGAVTITATVNS